MILGRTKGNVVDVFPKAFMGFINLSGPRNCNVYFHMDSIAIYEIFDRWCHDRDVYKASIKNEEWFKMDQKLIHSMFAAHINSDHVLMVEAERICRGFMSKDVVKRDLVVNKIDRLPNNDKPA